VLRQIILLYWPSTFPGQLGAVVYEQYNGCRLLLSSTLQTPMVSQARAKWFRLMDQAAELHQPITIAGRRSDVVHVCAQDWQAIQETLYRLSVPGMRESI
jgi:antitoxin YefM